MSFLLLSWQLDSLSGGIIASEYCCNPNLSLYVHSVIESTDWKSSNDYVQSCYETLDYTFYSKVQASTYCYCLSRRRNISINKTTSADVAVAAWILEARLINRDCSQFESDIDFTIHSQLVRWSLKSENCQLLHLHNKSWSATSPDMCWARTTSSNVIHLKVKSIRCRFFTYCIIFTYFLYCQAHCTHWIWFGLMYMSVFDNEEKRERQ